jgi:hypothetical protein
MHITRSPVIKIACNIDVIRLSRSNGINNKSQSELSKEKRTSETTNKKQEKFLHEVKIQKSETVCSRWFIVCSFFMKRTEVILFIACGVYPELVEGSLTSAVRTFLRSYEIQATSHKTFSNFQISNYDNAETVFDPFCK